MWLSGIAGGGFMLVRSPNGSYEFIDFREVAPAAAFQDMYVNNSSSSLYGGLARSVILLEIWFYINENSGVPGELRGLQRLHSSYGKLPWRDLVYPSAELASNGFVVTADQVKNMNALGLQKRFLSEDADWAIDFAPNGTLVGIGDIMTRKRYGEFLKRIALGGADVFYEGPIAQQIIAALRAANGTMSLADLKNYAVTVRKPVDIIYRGFRVVSCSAPSSGVVVLSVLKTVEGYADFGSSSALNLNTHRLDESIRFGYGAVSFWIVYAYKIISNHIGIP
jgi:gamma-glutamyltranspeptidase/glutathione hydrolase